MPTAWASGSERPHHGCPVDTPSGAGDDREATGRAALPHETGKRLPCLTHLSGADHGQTALAQQAPIA